MEFFVMTPEVSLWDFKMLSVIMSLVSFLFSAAFFAPSDLLLSLIILSSTLPAKPASTFISRNGSDELDCGGALIFSSAMSDGWMNVFVCCYKMCGISSGDVSCEEI
jgi:hypothetical protein